MSKYTEEQQKAADKIRDDIQSQTKMLLNILDDDARRKSITLFIKDGEEMKQIVESGEDLYNAISHQYIFDYNDRHSIAEYNLRPEKVASIINQNITEGNFECWSEILGPGGYIVDSAEYIKERGDIDPDQTINTDDYFNLMPLDGWIRCSDLEVEYAAELNNLVREDIEL